MTNRKNRQNGYALFSVLGVVSLLSLIAASLTLQSRLVLRAELNAWRDLQSDTTAEAVTAYAVLTILRSSATPKRRFNGAAERTRFDGAEALVAISDELGKVDLNFADARTLDQLFRSVDASDDRTSLVESVLAWRSGSDAVGPFAPAIGRSGFREFRSIAELRLIEGVSDDLMAALFPALTVHGGGSAVDFAASPRLVLDALKSQSSRVSAAAPARQSATPIVPESGAITDWQVSALNGRAFAINVTLNSRHYRSVIRFTGDLETPYWVLERAKQ